MKLVSVNLFHEDKLSFLPLAIVPSEMFTSNNFVLTYLSSYFQCKVNEFNIVAPGKRLTYVGNDSVQYLINDKDILQEVYLFNRDHVFYNYVSPEGIIVLASYVDRQFALMPKDLMVESI